MNHSTVDKFSGFIKIWRVNKQTGAAELVIDKKNTILFQGSDLLAQAIGGNKNAKISNMYIGYVNTEVENVGSISLPAVNKDYTANPFSSYGNLALPDQGYLRLPLAYSPTYQASSTDYSTNQVIFSATIATENETQDNGGADFLYADDPSMTPSHVCEVALAAAIDPGNPAKDLFFSRANFTPIPVDRNYNLTISWGIQFLS